jgi:hypothetical protein
VLEKGKMAKGFNKSGDAAVIVYLPKKIDSGEEPEIVGLLPVSDYKVFVGNFAKADKPSGIEGVTAVKDPDGNETIYVAHRGSYAAVSNKTDQRRP